MSPEETIVVVNCGDVTKRYHAVGDSESVAMRWQWCLNEGELLDIPNHGGGKIYINPDAVALVYPKED